MGPHWCYWAFPTERFCGSLLPAIKSRRYPFTSIDHRVRDIAQLDQIKLIYNLTCELNLGDWKDAETSGHIYEACKLTGSFLGILFLTHFLAHFTDPNTFMIRPSTCCPIDAYLRKKIAHHLVTNYGLTSTRNASALIPAELQHWGRLLQGSGGDMIHAADLIARADLYRDASYIKVSQ